MYERLEGGLLKNGLYLFGDNAYLKTRYMATPYPNVSSGSKDDYNFFQSQLRIRVECAFGQLVTKWGILRSAIPTNITIVRTVALVSCLVRLHNFCINKGERLCEMSCEDEAPLPMDLENMMNNPEGYVPLVTNDNHDVAIPTAIMDAGHHFDDCSRAARRGKHIEVIANNDLPRTILLNHIVDSHETHPHTNMRTKKKS